MATGFLSDASVRRLRRKAEAGMTATCAVMRPASTAGPGGSQEIVAPIVTGLAALPCAFAPEGAPEEFVAADAVLAAARFVVRFPVESFGAGLESIRPDDTLSITHTVAGVPSPLVLAVIGDRPRSVYEVTRRVLARRTTPGGV